MAGNPMKRNQNLYCQYHQDQGHTIKDCRNLWDHLDQLVQEGKLKHLLHRSSGQQGQTNPMLTRDTSSRSPIGTINVIFAASGRTGSYPSRVMSVAQLPSEESDSEPKRARIGGYDVKRVMVDDDSSAEIMYSDLYKGLNLRPKDLIAYDSSLISFDGNVVTPRGQIRLPVQAGTAVVEVDFIMMDAYSPYTAIVARP
ncbi:uncharacterized protein LOC115981201 [Quercus lobata]|uniref:uncharacterized protein LOC115981201 n=1 Tax=Quercus lobata TaxID=97700 RepID=UPI0012483DF1|nr:uncharacterized protein LOC115981201 [Quercus lobata]